MDCIGKGCECKDNDLRICDKHPLRLYPRGTSVPVKLGNNEVESIAVEPFYVPVSHGDKSSHVHPQMPSNGIRLEQEMVQYAKKVSREESNLSLMLQLALAKEAPLHESNKENVSCKNVPVITGENDDAKKDGWQKPSIALPQLHPKKVKQQTGFHYLY